MLPLNITPAKTPSRWVSTESPGIDSKVIDSSFAGIDRLERRSRLGRRSQPGHQVDSPATTSTPPSLWPKSCSKLHDFTQSVRPAARSPCGGSGNRTPRASIALPG